MLSRRRDAIRYEYVSQPFEMNRRVVRALFFMVVIVARHERRRCATRKAKSASFESNESFTFLNSKMVIGNKTSPYQ